MAGKFLNLSTDTTLGGNSPSDYLAPSEKAIKTYVDNHSGGGGSYTAGTGLQLDNNEFSIVQSDSQIVENFTKTGNGTLTEDYLYTGANNAYLQMNVTLPLSTANSWEFRTKIKYLGYSGTIVSYPPPASSYDKKTIFLDNTSVLLSSNGSSWGLADTSFTNSMSSGTSYYFKFGFTGSQYYVKRGTDGWDGTFTDLWTLSSTTKVYNSAPVILMCNGYSLNGNQNQMDLNETSVIIDGSTYWQAVEGGSEYTVAKATENLYGLVKPDGDTIKINDGVISTASAGTGLNVVSNQLNILQEDVQAVDVNIIGTLTNTDNVYSGFSGYSNYLEVPLNITLEATDEIDIQIKFYCTSDSSTPVAIMPLSGSTTYDYNAIGLMTYYWTTNTNLPRAYFPSYDQYSRYVSFSNTTYKITLNAWNWYRFTRTVSNNSTTFTLYHSTDGENWQNATTTYNGTYSTWNFEPMRIGAWEYSGGNCSQIDLNECYIKKNNEVLWGKGLVSKTVAKATTSLYGLVKPDGTSITVNDGVISSSGVTVDQTYNSTSANAQSGVAINGELTTNYQTKLVSGTSIKTINSTSLLGSGNIDTPYRNIGEIVQSTIPLTDSGLHLLDGSLLSYGSYQAFIDYIADLYDSGNYSDIFETESNWQSSVTTYGVCGKFVYNEGSPKYYAWSRYDVASEPSVYTIRANAIIYPGDYIYDQNGNIDGTIEDYGTDEDGTYIVYDSNYYYRNSSKDIAEVKPSVRLPKITGFTESTIDPTVLGDLTQAGLPNITGEWYNPNLRSYQATASGAFFTTSGSKSTGCAASTNGTAVVNFNASRSSSIYGNASTVQPQSIKVLYYIVIANLTKTAIQVDIDEIATDLNGKADTDLSNVNNTGTSKVAGWAMPSTTYSDFTIGASGASYTMPANGWLTCIGLASAAGQYLNIINADPITSATIADCRRATGSSQYIASSIPVLKGDIIIVGYTLGTMNAIRFVYAKGSESEAS